jgi:endonuclease/exonuclease/phosphatase family metal-dependent hydrolase
VYVLFFGTVVAVSIPVRAGATTDVAIGGTSLRLRASQTTADDRRLTFRSAFDGAIAPPFPDPTLGANLVVFSSHGAGGCRAEVTLDPTKWTPIRGDGPGRGWQYRADAPGTLGVRGITLARRAGGGRIVVRARGAGWPCGLEAGTQPLPVSVILRVADTRYCAAFDGGTIRSNETGRFGARAAAPPAACLDGDLTVANINILHGIGCPGNCRLGDRIALFYQWVAASGCPDIITMQEIINQFQGASTLPFLVAQRQTTCPFPYTILYFGTNALDGELILTRYPILASEVRGLKGGFRNVLFARIDHPIGPVDVFTTHLASSSDGGPSPCGSCPQECVDAGAVTNRDCQAVQLALFAEEKHDVAAPAVIAGDFNDPPGTFTYNQFVGRGWIDTYLAAGNPECNPGTGVGCTSGRDTTLAEIETTVANVDERIDYTFLIPPGPGDGCSATLDSPADDDGDGTATRIFADAPNPFSACGPLPAAVCWPSDHEGTEMDLDCE